MSATHGKVKPPVCGVKARRRLDAGEARRGGGVRNRLPATKHAAETAYVMPRLARIQWDTREAVGWRETTAAMSSAAAGARLRAGAGCGARGGHPRGSSAPSWHQEHDWVLGGGWLGL